jgi:hypothetical protein
MLPIHKIVRIVIAPEKMADMVAKVRCFKGFYPPKTKISINSNKIDGNLRIIGGLILSNLEKRTYKLLPQKVCCGVLDCLS